MNLSLLPSLNRNAILSASRHIYAITSCCAVFVTLTSPHEVRAQNQLPSRQNVVVKTEPVSPLTASKLTPKLERITPAKQNLLNFEDADLGQLRLKETQNAEQKNSIDASTGNPSANSSDQPSDDTQAQPLNQFGAAQSNEDEDLGSFPIRPIPVEDEDLGTLPVRPIAPPRPKPKWFFTTARVDYFANSNAFSTNIKRGDGLIRTGLTLTAFPRLGPKTFLLGAVDGNVIRYGRFSQLNYDELRLRASILQQLSAKMYGEIGWSNQKLYAASDGLRNVLSGEQFLNENSFQLSLSRTDKLSPKVSLSSFYQLRWSLSSRNDNDRLSNTVFTSLNYRLSPSWLAALDYTLSWSHYTQFNRDDIFQQVQLRTRYALSKELSLSVFGGFSFGGSTDDRQRLGLTGTERLQYDNWSIGVNLVFSKGLF